jgi:hypothetical protein
VDDLAAARGPAATGAAQGPTDRYARWSLGQLADYRAALGDRLTASAPPDVAPAQRRLEDDRAWGRARRQPSDALDEQRRTLAAAAEGRRQWLETHAGELDEWVDLGQAMGRRAGALAVATEARPSRVVLAEIGPPPSDERDTSRWQHAAQELEAFRDRWGLADDPAGLPHTVGDGEPRRHLGRVLAATRAVTQDRALSRGPPCWRSQHVRGIRAVFGGVRASELFHGAWSSTMIYRSRLQTSRIPGLSHRWPAAALGPEPRPRGRGRLHRGRSHR